MSFRNSYGTRSARLELFGDIHAYSTDSVESGVDIERVCREANARRVRAFALCNVAWTQSAERPKETLLQAAWEEIDQVVLAG